MNINQRQSQNIRLMLNPQMIQRLRLFQLSYEELLSEIMSQSKENVLIEITQEDRLLRSSLPKKDDFVETEK